MLPQLPMLLPSPAPIKAAGIVQQISKLREQTARNGAKKNQLAQKLTELTTINSPIEKPIREPNRLSSFVTIGKSLETDKDTPFVGQIFGCQSWLRFIPDRPVLSATSGVRTFVGYTGIIRGGDFWQFRLTSSVKR